MSGADAGVKAACVNIQVAADHPLIRLAQALPWKTLMEMVAPDLKKTTAKGCWWTGPKLKIRIHLAAYILKKLYNLTDRKTEYGLRDSAAYQIFCSKEIVHGWHAPDHTKIENFRSRLSPETQRATKGKVGKEREFGRVFHLGRVDRGFLFAMASQSLHMNNKQSLLAMVEKHATLFGQN